MSDPFAHLGLAYNPFAPSAAGAPIGGDGGLWLPSSWKDRLQGRSDR